EHVQVPDESLEASPVAGCTDDGVRNDPAAVGKRGAVGVQRFDAPDDLDAAIPNRIDDLLVDDRRSDPEAGVAGEDSFFRNRKSKFTEVADRLFTSDSRDRVSDSN